MFFILEFFYASVHTEVYFAWKQNEIRIRRKNIMNQIVITIITILFGLIGGLTSLYLLLSIPAIIILKIFRCVKYGKSMYD